MKLRFKAREGFYEPDPRFPRGHGLPVRRIGRELDGTPTAEPAEFDSETPEGARVFSVMTQETDLRRRAASAPLIPADKETAAACGLPFVSEAATKQGKAGEQ